MLKIKHTMNLCLLADDMIETIVRCWDDPFNPPTVILPDSMTENWFNQYWIKTCKKRPILMNLTMKRLDSFLFDILNPKDNKVKPLSPEMLHFELIKELSTYKYNDNLDPELKYIFDGDKISHLRLYDFAKTMANLFIEYEVSRPKWFNNEAEWSGWQKKLYEKTCKSGCIIDGTKYKTIAELYYENGSSVPTINTSNPNFIIFGFSGMGQLYREILDKIAKQTGINLFLYIQYPADKNIEKHKLDKNYPINTLGLYGSENFDEWKNIAEEKIEPLQDNDNENYPKCELNAAPSKIREVEIIHSKICSIIQNYIEQGNGTFNDIKVFAPNIKDYIPAINLVFGEPMIPEDEVEKKLSYTKDSDFSYGIPYSINDFSSASSYVVEAMRVLVDIAQKQYFNRVDFLSLVKNPVVQASRGISEEDISYWKNWIDGMNIYRRNTDKSRDDWTNAKRRLLLSKLTDEPLEIRNKEEVAVDADEDNNDKDIIEVIIPYDANSSDDSILRFVSLIDDIYEWTDLTNKEDISCKDSDDSNIEKIRVILKNFLSMRRHQDEELDGERAVNGRLMGCLSLHKKIFETSINKQCLLLSMIDAISDVSLSETGVTKGIEFISFKPNRIIPAKHVFFMGLDSNSFPGIDAKNVLDKREKEKGDDSVSEKNKNAFLCEIMATSVEFHMSYVNKDLQKDEDFYSSPVVNAIVSFMQKQNKDIPQTQLGIDETRNHGMKIDEDINNLYTFRRLRNFRNQFGTKSSSVKMPSIESTGESVSQREYEQPKTVSISQLRKFLEEPFKFQAEKAFAYDEDDEKDNLKFEPIELDNLEKTIIRKTVLQQGKYGKEDIIRIMSENNCLPYGEFGTRQAESLSNDTTKISGEIDNILRIEMLARHLGISLIKYEAKGDANNFCTTVNNEQHEWKAIGKFSYYNPDYSDGRVICAMVSSDNRILEGYSIAFATALVLIAKESPDKVFNIEFYVIDKQSTTLSFCSDKSYKLTASMASSLLFYIYRYKYWIDYNKTIPKELKLNSLINAIALYKQPDKFESEVAYYFRDGKIRYKVHKKKTDEEKVVQCKKGNEHLYNYLSVVYSDPTKVFYGKELYALFTRIGDNVKQISDLSDLTKNQSVFNCKKSVISYDPDFSVPVSDFTIKGSGAFYNSDYRQSRRIICIDIKSKSELKDFLNCYVTSLVLAADSDNFNKEQKYVVDLFVVTNEGKSRQKHFSITKLKAIDCLKFIRNNAFSGDNLKCFPIEAFYNKELKGEPSFRKLAEFIEGQSSPWQFFKKSKLIDVNEGLGYNLDAFESEWQNEKAKMKNSIELLSPDDESDTSKEAEYEY